MEGLDLTFPDEASSLQLRAASKKYIENGFIRIEGNFIKLTNEGKLLADGIAADLFFTQQAET
jgi:oxygen-independent coproporphyrinogen-3 oxidase